MSHRPVESEAAPRPVGPYSQAIAAGRLVFCAGQIALDPTSGELRGGGAGAETERVLENLAAVLRAAGLGLDAVVKTTIFLIDLADMAAVNEVYARYFSAPPPARSSVQVVALPRGARVEIEAIAVRPG